MQSEKKKKMKSRGKEENIYIYDFFQFTGKEGDTCCILNLTSFYALLSAIFMMHW